MNNVVLCLLDLILLKKFKTNIKSFKKALQVITQNEIGGIFLSKKMLKAYVFCVLLRT